MNKAEALNEALEMYLKVRKLKSVKYKCLEEYVSAIQVVVHISQERTIVEKLRKELIQYADCRTESDVRRIGTSETLVVYFRWSYED